MLNRLSPGQMVVPVESESSISLRDAIGFVWRQWPFIAGIIGVTLVVGITYLLRQTPLYTASAQVLLDPTKEKAGGADPIYTEFNLDLRTLENQVEIIQSPALLRRVVEKENMLKDPEFAPASAGSRPPSLVSAAREYLPQMLGGSKVEKAARALGSNQAIPPDVMAAIGSLQGALRVDRPKGSIITISMTSTDPARAARLANAVADAYILDRLDSRFEAAKRASGWLSDRLVELRKQVRESEDAVRIFREQNNLLVSATNVTLNQQQLSELNSKLVAARAEVGEKKARLDLLNEAEKKGTSAQNLLPDLVNSPVVASLRAQLAMTVQKEADLSSRYGSGHPLVINVRAERRDLERNLAGEISKLAANVRNDYELAKARAESLEKSLREATGQSDADSGAIITLRELERTAAVNKTLFEDFLQRSKVTQEQSTFEDRQARVLSPALPPLAPSYPQKGRIIMMTLVLGLLLGIGGAVAKEALNAGFTTPQQVEDILELPLLSSVSRMDSQELKAGDKSIDLPQYPAVKPLSRYSETIRTIRSGVQMTDVDRPPKVVQFTSTVPSEGKTTIGLSVATSAANSGLKTLFIDGDLRRPSASSTLGLKKDKGLVELLLGQASAQETIRYHEKYSFWVLPAGGKTQNPPDLLGSERMKSFIATFRNSFDYIVIDSPPMGPVIDPTVISQLVDKVVFVVRWASTAREVVKHSVQQLAGDKKVAGVVFNQVNENQARKYGKYGYSYYGTRYYRNYYTEG